MSDVTLKNKLIEQLMRESLSGNLNWVPKKAPIALAAATDNYIPLYLEAFFKNATIGLYEVRYKYYTDEETFHWSEMGGICVMKYGDLIAWKIEENSPALRELIQIAGEKASGLEQFFTDL